MLLLQAVLFLACATGIGFLIARFVLVPTAEPGPVEVRWRTEAENAARECDRLRAELAEARRDGNPDSVETRIGHLKSALQAAKGRITELEGDLVAARRSPTAGETEVIGIAPPALGAAEGTADDLKRINGIGPGIEHKLNELGIWHYQQIAALSRENVAWLDRKLPVRGRIERQEWIAQAQALAGGSQADLQPAATATAD